MEKESSDVAKRWGVKIKVLNILTVCVFFPPPPQTSVLENKQLRVRIVLSSLIRKYVPMANEAATTLKLCRDQQASPFFVDL